MLRGPSSKLTTVIASVPGDADENAFARSINMVAATLEKGSAINLVNQEQWLPSLSAELGEFILTQTTAPEAMSTLIHNPPAMLLLPEHLAGPFAAAAVGLSGTEKLAFEVRGESDLVHFAHYTPSPGPVEPAALIFASVWLLLGLGEHSAAERLHNALLLTLEEGLHTRALQLNNPYTRVLSPDELIKAVEDRLDRHPRHLARVHYSPRSFRSAVGPNLIEVR
jgi:hypothetical protein